MANTRIIAIHSKRLAIYLMIKDCILKGVSVDRNKENFFVYLFNDTPYLQENIDTYRRNPNIKEELRNIKERM